MINKNDFKDFQLSNELLKSIRMLKFSKPTPIQEQVIPRILEKRDVIIKAQTGSGKTAAFAIPICELIDWSENKPQALVITPTRELAVQVKEDISNLGSFKRLKVSAIFGRVPISKQILELKQKTHIVVGTPGRIIDHLERGSLDLSMIKYLIIDEIDEMLKMGFIEQIEAIISSVPSERVTVVLSATLPSTIENLCNQFLKNPIRIEIEAQTKTVEKIIQEYYSVAEIDKIDLLKEIMIIENPDSCIIFCNTKQMVDKVYEELKKESYPCERIHGGMDQRDRLKIMNDCKRGYFRYLLATDVASRGIDIEHIDLVINYDLPKEVENYVHRIGRTGRIDNEGKAITFVEQREVKFFDELIEYTGKEILKKEKPEKETVEQCKNEFYQKIQTMPKLKSAKDKELRRGIVKLHINAGKKTKMRASDIVGAICSISGISPDDIGVINILDIATFVDILNNKGEIVLKELQKVPIKGKLRKVNKSGKTLL